MAAKRGAKSSAGDQSKRESGRPESSRRPASKGGKPRGGSRSGGTGRRRPRRISPGDSAPLDVSEGPIRLQKLMASAGVGSRRECETLIEEGRVEVDRQIVTELGSRVDPQKQEVRVDGEVVRPPARNTYYAVNKPVGVVCTNLDPEGRTRVIDLIPSDRRIYTVGRLDRSSEGLILVTDDGEMANRLTHPKFGIPKTYLARVAGSPSYEELNQLKEGVYLSDGLARVESIRIKKRHPKGTDLIIVLTEGKNREIRRILAKIGHKVLKLKRTAVGELTLGDLPSGGARTLSYEEVNYLRYLCRKAEAVQKAKKSRKKTAYSDQRGGRPGAGSRGKGTAGKGKPSRQAKGKKSTYNARGTGSKSAPSRPMGKVIGADVEPEIGAHTEANTEANTGANTGAETQSRSKSNRSKTPNRRSTPGKRTHRKRRPGKRRD